uniref:P-type phospholipid transporter n=1 Tax=Accipiter nisus TaxID=211598 RepID=A0A8B9NBF3_9AVES
MADEGRNAGFPRRCCSRARRQPQESCGGSPWRRRSCWGRAGVKDPGSSASMAEQDQASGSLHGKKQLPAFTWEVRANDRNYHMQFKKKFAFCLTKKKYAGNAIKTAKYNIFTFLPLNLYEQFHRMANVYFVFVILLQTFPEISTLPWYTLLFPLSCLLTIRGLRDLIDDIGRHQSDRNINSRPCEILSGKSFCWQKWRDICVGDIVRLRKESFVPADMLLLCSSEPSSLCYVETADIDGETNLKFRQALLVTHQELVSEEIMAAFDGRVTCEEPNSRMHSFTGTLEWRGETYSLDSEKILLRGCKIRNTDVCYGLVIYAGTGTGRENKQPSGSGLTWSHHGEKKLDFCDATLLEAARRDSDPVLREFLRLLALCHTVMVEEKGDQLVYQAASPDEEALVLAARNLGYVFLARTQDTITISELGVKRTYKVLAMLDFNSDRKRMSVLVRDPQGTIRLYTKGADTVILERLQRRGPNETFTEMALDRFAEETLRTLCLASKEVSEVEYSVWSRRHREASILLQDRARELDKLYEEMEQNLQLLGATAIEDKLQDGVPETIQLLKLGNIKVWVLTGDKQETAMNIGYACKLLTDDMEILEEKEISKILRTYWVSNNHLSSSGEVLCSGCLSQQRPEASRNKKRALIISGDFLDKILHTGEVLKEKGWLWQRLACCRATGSQEQGSLVEKAFVDLATSCQAVICCRVTPKQKALIVELVKKHKKAITLAIGDGANDVNMIKTADIGVGISGLEGMQAVQCSDYALAQFSYLQRLLLVHGRWAYLRICKFLRYFFYKTFAGLMAQVWFAFHSGFTAQPLYEGWFLALYNIFYTAYPVLSVGLLEQDVSAKKSLEFPELYVIGQQDELFNYRVFGITLLHGVSTSLASFYIALWAFEDHVGSKVVGDYESFAVTVATSALLSVLVEFILDTKFWTALSFLMVTASLLLFCFFSFLTQSIDAFRIAPAIFRFPDASWNALTDPYVLLVVLLSLVVNTIPSLTVHLYCTITGKTTIQQKIRLKAKREPEPSVELRAHVPHGSFHRRSSYAFSHQEGYAGLITRGDSLRARTTRRTAPGLLHPETTPALSSLPSPSA